MKYQFYDLFSPTYITHEATPKSIYVLGWFSGRECNAIYAVHKYIKSRAELTLLRETSQKIADAQNTDPDWPYLGGLLYVSSNPRVPEWDIDHHWISEDEYLALMNRSVVSSMRETIGYEMVGKPLLKERN